MFSFFFLYGLFFVFSNLESKCSGSSLKALKSTKGTVRKPVTPKAVALISDEEIKCLQEDDTLFAKGFAAVNVNLKAPNCSIRCLDMMHEV